MAKAKALFLTDGGHIGLEGNRDILEDVLVRQAGLDLDPHDTPDFSAEVKLSKYDLIVDYSGNAKIEPTMARLSLLVKAVYEGLSYVALHAATLPFRQSGQLEYVRALDGKWPTRLVPNEQLNETQLRYLEMLGTAFVNHGPIRTFTLQVLQTEHPITEGVGNFEIEDELYVLVGNFEKLEILAQAEGEPLVYTAQWGEGKVYYNALGHDTRSLSNPNYQRLLAQGVEWALG